MFQRTLIVGVMGGGGVADEIVAEAYRLGACIAQAGWVLLNGGRNAGVMAASARGAAENGGLTVGVLPDTDRSRMAEHIHIPICTGMGSARNSINVLSSDVVVACAGGAGTISEIALALKHAKPVITLHMDTATLFREYRKAGKMYAAESPEQVIDIIRRITADPTPCSATPPSGALRRRQF